MKQVVNWVEWTAQIRQDVEPLEDAGKPARLFAEGDRLDPDMFLDLLGELESRGVPKDSLVAVLSPAQVAGLLVTVNFLERKPADLDDPLLPEDMVFYGVPVRAELGFPSDTLVMCDPARVTFDGFAINPQGTGIVEDLSVPDLSDADISVEDVRRSMFPELYSRGSTGQEATDAPDTDPERKGSRFVEDPDDEQEGDA